MEDVVYRELAEMEARHWWFVARRRVVRRVLAAAGLPADARILEAGCGTGGNLALLGEFGRVEALEPEDYAREHARQRSGVEVRPGHLPDAVPFPEESYDLVVALDVLEHVEEDRTAVAALAARLKPGGLALFTVPAYRFMWSEHDEVLHHKRRYTLAEFERLVAGSGLQRRHATYFNSLLFPVAFAKRAADRALGRHESENRIPPAWLNRSLQAVMSAEAPLVPRCRLPFGLSLLYLGEKSG